MARTINEQEYATKRKEILDAALRLVYTKGYERMTVQDIQVELKISSGAFYHYFSTKQAVLEALIEQMQQEAERPLLPIVHDPRRSATEKLKGYFAVLEGSRTERRAFLIRLVRVWYADDNAIVRQKVDEAILKRRAPLLMQIIEQGIQEDVFHTPYPAQVSQVILTLAGGMGDALARLMIAAVQAAEQSVEQAPGQVARCIEEIVATQVAYTESMEHALGAAAPFLDRLDTKTVRGWLGVQSDGTMNLSNI